MYVTPPGTQLGGKPCQQPLGLGFSRHLCVFPPGQTVPALLLALERVCRNKELPAGPGIGELSQAAGTQQPQRAHLALPVCSSRDLAWCTPRLGASKGHQQRLMNAFPITGTAKIGEKDLTRNFSLLRPDKSFCSLSSCPLTSNQKAPRTRCRGNKGHSTSCAQSSEAEQKLTHRRQCLLLLSLQWI